MPSWIEADDLSGRPCSARRASKTRPSSDDSREERQTQNQTRSCLSKDLTTTTRKRKVSLHFKPLKRFRASDLVTTNTVKCFKFVGNPCGVLSRRVKGHGMFTPADDQACGDGLRERSSLRQAHTAQSATRAAARHHNFHNGVV